MGELAFAIQCCNSSAGGPLVPGREYPERLEAYKGNILLVGINYNKDIKNTSPEFKHHNCEIDRA